MKTLKDDTAFPCPIDNEGLTGLTKREYFAGLAMQGLLANNTMLNANGTIITKHLISKLAIATADALIDQLNK